MALGHNIKTLMDLHQVTYQSLADHCDTDAQAIQALVKRDSAKSRFVSGIAEYFGIPMELLINGNTSDVSAFASKKMSYKVTGDNPISEYPHVAKEPPPAYIHSLLVKIAVIGQSGGDLEMKSDGDSTIGRPIKWPSDDPNAFAIRMHGNQLSPRCKHGEFVIAEPSRTVSPGDEVLLYYRDGDRMALLSFQYERDGMAFFEDINGTGARINVEINSIQKLVYVSGYAKSSLLGERIEAE